MSYDLNAFNSEQWKQLLDTIKQGGGSSSGGITDEQIEELVEAIKSSKSVVASGEVGVIQDSLQWDDLVNSILGIEATGITDTQIQSLVTAIEKTKTINGTITNTHDSSQFERLIEAIESSGGSVTWDDITGKPSLLYPSDVINSLISTETEKPLSADRGRYLYDLILNEHTEVGNLSNLVGDGSEIAQIGDGTVCNVISELNSTLAFIETDISTTDKIIPFPNKFNMNNTYILGVTIKSMYGTWIVGTYDKLAYNVDISISSAGIIVKATSNNAIKIRLALGRG